MFRIKEIAINAKTTILTRNSSNWMQRHVSDQFVKSSKSDGYRARSAYKLIEIFERFPEIKNKCITSKSNVIDIGAAPGSWSQIISGFSKDANIIAVDLLPIKQINGVQVFTCDFNDFSKSYLQSNCVPLPKFNCILSDMSVNLTGVKEIDQPRNFELWSSVLEFVKLNSNIQSSLVIKVFESSEANLLRKELNTLFQRVISFKPKSSRQESSEKYLVCLNKLI